MFSVDNMIELGDMAPNETLTGDLYFGVDYTDSGMKLEYLPFLPLKSNRVQASICSLSEIAFEASIISIDIT